MLYVLRQVLTPSFSDDDAFFFDLSYHLVNEHKLALDTYGPVLAHDNFVASIPILYPLITAIDVYAVQITKNVIFAKLSSLLILLALMIVVAQCLYKSIYSILGFSMVFLVVITDGMISTSFGSLRYDGWLILVMTLLYIAMNRALDLGGWKNILWLLLSILAAALSHWQMLATIGAVLMNLILFGVRKRKVTWLQVLSLVAIVGLVYAGYFAYLIINPVRSTALRLQLLVARSYSGQPASIDLLKKAKVLFGNLFYSNSLNSLFSLLLLFLLISAATLIFKTMVSRSRVGPGTRLWSDLLFLVCGLAPAFSQDYVGARWVPLYIVVVLIIAQYIPLLQVRDMHLWHILGPLLCVNYFGYLLFARYGLRFHGPQLFVTYALLLLTCYPLYLLSRATMSRMHTLHLLASFLLVFNLGVNMKIGKFFADPHNPASNTAVRELMSATAKIMPAISSAQANSQQTVEIFCDPTIHYFPLRFLDSQGRIVIRSLFPLLYFSSDVAQQQFLEAFQPDYLLMSDDDINQLRNDSKIGARFLQYVRDNYVKIGSLASPGINTAFYRRSY
jgi:hypothetical protein